MLFQVFAIRSLSPKREALLDILRQGGRVAVAFSGGVDSAVVACAAQLACGEQAFAVTAVSPSLASGELDNAVDIARRIGIRHVVIDTQEFSQTGYIQNAGNRCYYCKTELYVRIEELAAREPFDMLVNGANADDLGDHRPGMRAAAEAGAQWPLATLGFTKAEVRNRSHARGLPSWNRPAEPCLSSRVPYGERVTVAGLRMIEAAELVLKGHGFAECRARHHQAGERGLLCRIEVPAARLADLVALQAPITAALRALGYVHVTLDLGGLVSGGFNALLPVGSVETAAARGG